MSEMDFYMETLENLPAVINSSETMKERVAAIVYDFIQLQHL